ncbi:hypothetical protein Pyn_35673 [Prunus yedoensis var. nudiflora]|uniref:Uncharacterized protein n=1 Tax=Prunus yedoensis var. nudiflora TaxID=2094558 RepID=A0A314ZDI1_PRUYE|nr:hypothetical protein Pyn_35673 [Prunus yedoensis var. nudiflora]
MRSTAKKLKRMEKLINLVSKLKKMLGCSADRNLNRQVNVRASPPCAVRCEELFLPSKSAKGHQTRNNHVNPFLAVHAAAQNHFALRPNICI